MCKSSTFHDKILKLLGCNTELGLRIDKGSPSVALHLVHLFTITEAAIMYHTYRECLHLSLFDDAFITLIDQRIMENMNIKPICVFLRLFSREVSKHFDLGPSSYAKTLFVICFTTNFYSS